MSVIAHLFDSQTTEAAARGACTDEFTEAELTRKLLVAKTFTKMAPLILIMRGENIIADDFQYYSPCTGTLGKDEFLGLLRTTDCAFPTMKNFAGSFVVSVCSKH